MLILFYGQDGPDGNHDQKVVGNKKGVSKEEARRNFLYGILNYRMWIFTVTYGFCFGVELVIDNILAGYFYSQFSLNLIDAGRIASYSGLMNVCSRASGGLISDLFARRWGMRGRLWWLWFVQTAGGAVCLAFGFQTSHLGNATATMVIFSYLVQAACGATYGVVPFISKRSLGTVSGFVGAGGNTIAAIIQYIFFTNTQATTPEVRLVGTRGGRQLALTRGSAFRPSATLESPSWPSPLWLRAATSRCGAPCFSVRASPRSLLLAC